MTVIPEEIERRIERLEHRITVATSLRVFRRWYISAVASFSTCLTTALGLATGNPNWPLNMPLGLLGGLAVALLFWPAFRWGYLVTLKGDDRA